PAVRRKTSILSIISIMERNELYRIFLKVSQLNVLIVGGGNVGLEKLTFLLKSSPNATVEMLSPHFLDQTLELAKGHKVVITHDTYDKKYLEGRHMVIATTDKTEVNQQIYQDCREQNILVNV